MSTKTKRSKAFKSKKLKEMGEAGYKLVKEKYSWDIMAKRTYEEYEKQIG